VDKNLPKPQKEPRGQDRWIELRTQTERIEGVVFIPGEKKSRRISDLLLQADRGGDGMLHLSQAAVYDLETNDLKFRKRSLAINRAMVLYASPLLSGEGLPKRIWEPPKAALSTN